MRKFRLNQQPIQWPNKCAFCVAPATDSVETTCSVVTGVAYLVLFVRTTHLRTRVRYPVCAQHLWKARVGGIVSARNLFNLALGVGWAFLLIPVVVALYTWLVDGTAAYDPTTLAVYVCIVLAGIVLFVLGRRWSPVKLNSATEETVTISIANPSFAREFESLNRAAIVAVLPWWKA
jgi:hypothetical protein